MKNHTNKAIAHRLAFLAALSLTVTACGVAKVEGNTYAAGGDMVKVEFKSDGQAYVAMGPMSIPCTYAQKGAAVTLTCEGEATELKVDDDGALLGPPDSMMGRLTKQK